MLYTKLAYALAFTAAGVLANPSPVAQNNNAALTLDPKAVQSGSFADGTGAIGAEATQAKSLTSQNNFINFCLGKTLTNGLQFTEGSCNGIRK
jgi:transcription initiation factor TFIID subunit 15